MILDYLWRYPPYIILLIMVDLVSVSSPGVSYPPVGAALENFPARKRKKILVPRTLKKCKIFFFTYILAKKTSRSTIRSTPKIGDFPFDDGGQYPPKVIISRC
jgi:hypothetical protein